MIDPSRFGVSFSIKQCRNFGIDPVRSLEWLTQDAGFRRFRLMSYWNEHEQTPGQYDFGSLDTQFDQIEQVSGQISLCLGVRQPRWPESHWPHWALALPQAERYQRLADFITVVVKRYQDRPVVVSYQLENEALNRGFGLNGDFNRARLRNEFSLTKQLDPSRPVIMSTSNSYGLPLRGPIPDVIGFSLYRTMYLKDHYSYSKLPIWTYNLRALISKGILRRPCFIHELQLEPWGPKDIWEMTNDEQDKSMSTSQIATNVRLAEGTRLYPIDLWGGEWWYWRLTTGKDPAIWQAVHQALQPAKP